MNGDPVNTIDKLILNKTILLKQLEIYVVDKY